jgi:hypothetical protein
LKKKINDTEKKINICQARVKAVAELKLNNKKSTSSNSTVEVEEEEEDKNCMICMDAKANCAAVPCGHVCGCLQCMSKLKRKPCPICRVKIKDVIKLYMAVETSSHKVPVKSLRQNSTQAAAPFASVGITKDDARTIINESNGDFDMINKKLLEMAVTAAEKLKLNGKTEEKTEEVNRSWTETSVDTLVDEIFNDN